MFGIAASKAQDVEAGSAPHKAGKQQQDTKIRPGAFNEQFTAEKFADVLFSLMLSALLRQDYDPAAVLEIVRRTLY